MNLLVEPANRAVVGFYRQLGYDVDDLIFMEKFLDWIERVSMFCTEVYGVPPIAGRILGWLMICDPPEQSAGQIAEAIGASRASLVTNMRMLTGALRRHAAGAVDQGDRPEAHRQAERKLT